MKLCAVGESAISIFEEYVFTLISLPVTLNKNSSPNLLNEIKRVRRNFRRPNALRTIMTKFCMKKDNFSCYFLLVIALSAPACINMFYCRFRKYVFMTVSLQISDCQSSDDCQKGI